MIISLALDNSALYNIGIVVFFLSLKRRSALAAAAEGLSEKSLDLLEFSASFFCFFALHLDDFLDSLTDLAKQSNYLCVLLSYFAHSSVFTRDSLRLLPYLAYLV